MGKEPGTAESAEASFGFGSVVAFACSCGRLHVTQRCLRAPELRDPTTQRQLRSPSEESKRLLPLQS